MDPDKTSTTEEANGLSRDFSQVQVIHRAVRILQALRDSGGMNLSRLATEVGLARPTVHRIVSTLEADHLVLTRPDGLIQLGIELITLAAAVNYDLRRELRPYIEGLAMEVDETVDLALMNNGRLFFLDQVARPHRLRAVSGIGMSFPIYCTANGKALLATLTNEEVETLLPEQLVECAPNTIRTRDELLEDLERIRITGVAFDREEHTVGICAVGVTVHGPVGEVVAVSIPVPSVRFYGEEERFVTALKRTAEMINRRFEQF